MVKYEFLRQTRLTLQNSNKSQCINKLVFNFWPKRYIPSDWPKTVECIRNVFPASFHFFPLIYSLMLVTLLRMSFGLYSHTPERRYAQKEKDTSLYSVACDILIENWCCAHHALLHIYYIVYFLFLFLKSEQSLLILNYLINHVISSSFVVTKHVMCHKI